MSLEEPFGVRRVAAYDSVEEQPVLRVDHPHAVLPADRDEGPAVVLGGVPEPGDHRVQRVDVAAGVGAEVELAVEVEEAVEALPAVTG